MDPDDSVDVYRRRLLASLHVRPWQNVGEEPGSLQIFVNHECVGTMECDEAGHAVASITQPRQIQMVEIRTAAGLLIGSLCAQDLRMKMARLPVGDYVLEISIHNRVDGGSVQVAYQAAKPIRQQARPSIHKGEAPKAVPGSPPPPRWLPPSVWSAAVMAGRAGVAVAVLFLVVDRLADRTNWLTDQVHSPADQADSIHASSLAESSVDIREVSAPTLPDATEKALARQEEVLIRVMQGQERAIRTVQAQQHALAQAHAAIEGLSRGQQELSDRVSRVSHQMARLDENTRANMEARAKVEREAKPTAVTLAHTLPTDITAALPVKGHELTTLSPGSFPGIAEGTRDVATLAPPFTFWVSFQDNTPEKSIQDLIQEIHGRAGQINAGWYNVEVDLPQPQTPDLFMDSLKKMKIVKSVSMTLQTTSAR